MGCIFVRGCTGWGSAKRLNAVTRASPFGGGAEPMANILYTLTQTHTRGLWDLSVHIMWALAQPSSILISSVSACIEVLVCLCMPISLISVSIRAQTIVLCGQRLRKEPAASWLVERKEDGRRRQSSDKCAFKVAYECGISSFATWNAVGRRFITKEYSKPLKVPHNWL